jgi:hypothetical protein
MGGVYRACDARATIWKFTPEARPPEFPQQLAFGSLIGESKRAKR